MAVGVEVPTPHFPLRSDLILKGVVSLADYFSPNGNPYPYGYQKQYPTRVISGNQILELNGEQNQTLIGHTLAYCNELESALNEAVSKAEKYHARLVELGDIVPPKSPEELMQEQAAQQQEINAKLLEAIGNLQSELKGLKNNQKDQSGQIEWTEVNKNAKSIPNSHDGHESIQSQNSRSSGKGAKKLHTGQNGIEETHQ